MLVISTVFQDLFVIVRAHSQEEAESVKDSCSAYLDRTLKFLGEEISSHTFMIDDNCEEMALMFLSEAATRGDKKGKDAIDEAFSYGEMFSNMARTDIQSRILAKIGQN